MTKKAVYLIIEGKELSVKRLVTSRAFSTKSKAEKAKEEIERAYGWIKDCKITRVEVE